MDKFVPKLRSGQHVRFFVVFFGLRFHGQKKDLKTCHRYSLRDVDDVKSFLNDAMLHARLMEISEARVADARCDVTTSKK